MKIPLRNRSGQIVHWTIVDDEDHPLLSQIKWSAEKVNYPYAIGNIKIDGKWKTGIRMHRLIMQVEKGQLVDHINGNCLDNRKKNLRLCDRVGNGTNSKLPKNSSCGYKGVTYYKRYEKYGTPWMAQIGFKMKHYTIGYFKTALEAAHAYNRKAKEMHGEFAKLNTI